MSSLLSVCLSLSEFKVSRWMEIYLERETDSDESLYAEDDGDPNVDELVDVERLDEELREVKVFDPRLSVHVQNQGVYAENRLKRMADLCFKKCVIV